MKPLRNKSLFRRITATLAPGTDNDCSDGGVRRDDAELGGEGGGGGAGGAGRSLLREMHPTPAVCGTPRDVTYSVIGEVEGFDRFARCFCLVLYCSSCGISVSD